MIRSIKRLNVDKAHQVAVHHRLLLAVAAVLRRHQMEKSTENEKKVKKIKLKKTLKLEKAAYQRHSSQKKTSAYQFT